MSEQNGQKSKIIWYLIGLLQTIVLAICAWAGSNIVQAKSDIAVLQSSYSSLRADISEIKTDVKSLLRK